jgi:hypothetical protein
VRLENESRLIAWVDALCGAFHFLGVVHFWPTTIQVNKKPFIHSGTKGSSAVPPRLWSLLSACPANCQETGMFSNFWLFRLHHFYALTGIPGIDYSIHQCGLSLRGAGEFRLMRSQWAPCQAHTSLSWLAVGMTYYSCHDHYIYRAGLRPALWCGPSEIRTRDLLNAIETRSQLRYGPFLRRRRFYIEMFDSSTKVDLRGFEPLTSSVRLRRAPNCATGPMVQEFYLKAKRMSRKVCCFE